MKNIFKGKTSIIFDFDGTIAATVSLHESAFRKALEDYNLQFDYSHYIGMSTVDAIASIFQNNNKNLEKEELASLVNLKRKLANQSYQSGLKALPGAMAFIELVHQQKMQLFIGSSGSGMNVLAGVRALNIEHYFIDVITADDVKNAKPHPEIFLTILQKHKIDPAKAIVIEDADSGIEAAVRAGVEVVCVNPDTITYTPKTFHSKNVSFAELIEEFESYIQHEKSISGHRYL